MSVISSSFEKIPSVKAADTLHLKPCLLEHQNHSAEAALLFIFKESIPSLLLQCIHIVHTSTFTFPESSLKQCEILESLSQTATTGVPVAAVFMPCLSAPGIRDQESGCPLEARWRPAHLYSSPGCVPSTNQGSYQFI